MFDIDNWKYHNQKHQRNRPQVLDYHSRSKEGNLFTPVLIKILLRLPPSSLARPICLPVPILPATRYVAGSVSPCYPTALYSLIMIATVRLGEQFRTELMQIDAVPSETYEGISLDAAAAPFLQKPPTLCYPQLLVSIVLRHIRLHLYCPGFHLPPAIAPNFLIVLRTMALLSRPCKLSPLTATVSLLFLLILSFIYQSATASSVSLVPVHARNHHRWSSPSSPMISGIAHALAKKSVPEIPANLNDILDEKSETIIGGNPATENVVLHSCSIMLRRGSGAVFQCSGSILSRKRILTAAHCFFDFASEFAVTEVYVVPAQSKRRLGPLYVGRFVDVLKIYQPETLQHDVAIITINGIIREPIKTVKLPRRGQKTPRNSIATTAGYGQVRQFARLANVLRSVDLRLEAIRKCRLRFDKSIRGTIIREEVLCTVDPDPLGGKSLCSGDSGGPLFYEQSNGRLLQIGISSFTESICSSPGSTSWFTNLKTYSRSIREQKEGNLTAWERRLLVNL